MSDGFRVHAIGLEVMADDAAKDEAEVLLAGELEARLEEFADLEADEADARLEAIAEPMLELMADAAAGKVGRLEARLERLYREGAEGSRADDELEERLAGRVAVLEELGRRIAAVSSAKASRREQREAVETNARELAEQLEGRAVYVAEAEALRVLLKVGRLRRELEAGLEERLETCLAVIGMFNAALATLELERAELGRAW